MAEYEPVIGLEIHLQLKTASKAFCGCPTEFGKEPNTQVCPVCLGMPGSLPVLNKKAFEYALKVGIALNCTIREATKFDRKNYFYPDLPKDYQISQYDMPLAEGGFLEILCEGCEPKTIRIKRTHLEEDTGKLIHEEKKNISSIDFNRSGIPLLEIVTEPDINSAEEAYQFLTSLKEVLSYLDVSDCDMEKGSLRCDANISIRPRGAKTLGTKAEIKNMNSFKAVRAALEFEFKRQASALGNNEAIIQETRLWDSEREITLPMRSKESAHDYRYFPEPDLSPLSVAQETIEAIKKEIPELPRARRERFCREYELNPQHAFLFTQDKALSHIFEDALRACGGDVKTVSSWMIGAVIPFAHERKASFAELSYPTEYFKDLYDIVRAGTIASSAAKGILSKSLAQRLKPSEIVEKEGLAQVTDNDFIVNAVKEVVAQNQKAVEDYRQGRSNAIKFLVGQAMKLTRGKVDPNTIAKFLEDHLRQ
jgi:aspartyl-tRNA(Asn)/glutamyl-tRNA(Gln) amidotransferase subunit B